MHAQGGLSAPRRMSLIWTLSAENALLCSWRKAMPARPASQPVSRQRLITSVEKPHLARLLHMRIMRKMLIPGFTSLTTGHRHPSSSTLELSYRRASYDDGPTPLPDYSPPFCLHRLSFLSLSLSLCGCRRRDASASAAAPPLPLVAIAAAPPHTLVRPGLPSSPGPSLEGGACWRRRLR